MKPRVTLSSEVLELLGLTEKDLVVYQALLTLGTAPLRRIAEEAGLNRGTAYDALKHLLDVGLVSYVDAKTHRYFIGEDPHKLRGLATRREVAMREASQTLDGAIPALAEISGTTGHRPTVRYFERDDGVRAILEDVLETTERAESKTYRVYSSSAVRDLIAQAWPGYTRERVKRGVRVRAIAAGKGGVQAELSERKWLASDSPAPTYIFIYAGKTAYVAVDARKQLFGVIIEDPAIASTQTLIFDALWKTLP